MVARILHIINGENYAGAERVQDLLALRLPDYGYSVGFACIKPDKFPAQRMAKKVPVHLIPMASRVDFRVAFGLAKIIREYEYKLVHAHTPRAALVGWIAAALARVPMVYHVHSPVSRDTESFKRNLVNTWVDRLCRRGAVRLITVSHSLAIDLRRSGVESNKICTVSNGVPTPGPLPVREGPGEELLVGCVALFRPRKGLEVLLDALSLLNDQGCRVRLRAVGEFETPEYQSKIMGMVRERNLEDRIDWVGFSPDVNKELSRMDVLSLTSLFGEGMPMVILEAMAMGVPVVASDVEGVSEVIESDVSGYLVPPGDVRALVDALSGLIAIPESWSRIRKNAYLKQCQTFSDYSMAKKIASIYKEVLA